MDKIATGSATDRRDLFGESASQLGMNPAIVEKDFWVCWILKHLFAEPALKGQMVFKGGTSLSKVFGLIDRFQRTSVRRDGAGGIYDLVIASQTC